MPSSIDQAAKDASKLEKAAKKAETPQDRAKLLRKAIQMLDATIAHEMGTNTRRKAA